MTNLDSKKTSTNIILCEPSENNYLKIFNKINVINTKKVSFDIFVFLSFFDKSITKVDFLYTILFKERYAILGIQTFVKHSNQNKRDHLSSKSTEQYYVENIYGKFSVEDLELEESGVYQIIAYSISATEVNSTDQNRYTVYDLRKDLEKGDLKKAEQYLECVYNLEINYNPT